MRSRSACLLSVLLVLCYGRALVTGLVGAHIDGHGLLSRPHPLSRPNLRTAVIDWDPAVRLTINATRLERSGQWVEVSISGVREPMLDDLVMLMASGVDEDIATMSPLKYHFAPTVPSYMSSGEGVFRWEGKWVGWGWGVAGVRGLWR